MEMRPVAPVCRPDRPDLLTTPHLLPRLDQNGVEMPVIRLHKFPRAAFLISVEHNDHVTPAGAGFAREEDLAISHRKDRIAQVAVLTADSI